MVDKNKTKRPNLQQQCNGCALHRTFYRLCRELEIAYNSFFKYFFLIVVKQRFTVMIRREHPSGKWNNTINLLHKVKQKYDCTHGLKLFLIKGISNMIYNLVYEPSYLIALLSSSRSNEVDSVIGFSLWMNFLYPNVNEIS